MKKLKVTEIAKKLEISHSAVSQWFSGITKPTIDKALILEDEFSIPVTAWRNIKSFLSKHNDTIEQEQQSNLANIKEVS